MRRRHSGHVNRRAVTAKAGSEDYGGAKPAIAAGTACADSAAPTIIVVIIIIAIIIAISLPARQRASQKQPAVNNAYER